MSKPSPRALAITNTILPIVVFALLGYTWYIYVFRICAYLLQNHSNHTVQSIIFVIIATLFWFMSIICYARILFTPPGKPIHNTLPPSTEVSTPNLPQYYYSPNLFDYKTMSFQPANNQSNLSNTMPFVSICKPDGQPRFCHMCECFKPDRSHHCKECNSCVLKMDHHCPW
ncbi:hypothetical protein BDB01DRAFT_135481 [Pilobolus umbonatus]|nr:hypothetical protein BDB01DRAFT_135481 [Pilobolus umbonatus]